MTPQLCLVFCQNSIGSGDPGPQMGSKRESYTEFKLEDFIFENTVWPL